MRIDWGMFQRGAEAGRWIIHIVVPRAKVVFEQVRGYID
jgi:hypothetical protein